jgi:hypothetical protein
MDPEISLLLIQETATVPYPLSDNPSLYCETVWQETAGISIQHTQLLLFILNFSKIFALNSEFLYWIGDSHSAGYEESYLLGYNAM